MIYTDYLNKVLSDFLEEIKPELFYKTGSDLIKIVGKDYSLKHSSEPDSEHSVTAKRKPHIRRGHLRNQWYKTESGEREQKVIWIEPMFINFSKQQTV